MWLNRNAGYVKRTFQRIHGVGPGISSMIVLLLERASGIRFSDVDHRTMDVKPDVHVIRVFHRLGFTSGLEETEALKAARRLNPEYPGALDPPTWIIGKKWCAAVDPRCNKCPLTTNCIRRDV
jgi:endonuclease III